MSGEIYLGGGDGDVAVVESPTVGVVCIRFIAGITAYHPPVVVAPGMMALGHLLSPGAIGHSTDTYTLIGMVFGEVDVKTDTPRQAFGEHLRGNLTDQGPQRLEVSISTEVTEGIRH